MTSKLSELFHLLTLKKKDGPQDKDQVLLPRPTGLGRQEFGGPVRARELQAAQALPGDGRRRPRPALRPGRPHARVRAVAARRAHRRPQAPLLRQAAAAHATRHVVGRARRRGQRSRTQSLSVQMTYS